MILGTYGTGPWQITLNIAEVNTTALTFAAVSFSDGPAGYAVGWQQLAEANNSGAELWEYSDLSYQQFSYPQSGLAIQGDTSYDIAGQGNAQGLTVIADALVGDSVSPFIDPDYTGASVSTVSNSDTISTGLGTYNGGNGAVVIACISSETYNNGFANVTSVTGGGFTWQLRKKYQDPRSNCGQSMEIWYAIVPPGSGTEDYVNVTWDKQVDDGDIIVSSWGGVNQSQPFTLSGAASSNNNGGTPDSYLPTISFSGGFTIVSNNGGIPSGSLLNYYIVPSYRAAQYQGEITIPIHDIGGVGGLDFNDVNPNTGNAIYINTFDVNGGDNTSYLTQLVGNHTHLTFTQGNYHITYDCTDQAWQYSANYGGGGGPEIYHDPTYEGAPANSISIISTSGVAFNSTDSVAISVSVVGAPPTQVSHVYLPVNGSTWTGYGDDGMGHTWFYVGQPADVSGNPPQAGWKFLDDNGTVCTLRNDPVWFSGGAPSPYPNGAGWLCVVDRIVTFNDNNPSVTFFEQTPVSFTINSADLAGLGSIGGSQWGAANGTSGFTVTQSVNWIYNGVYGTLNNYTGIDAIYNTTGITNDNGYICNVIWGSGSSISSGLAKVGYNNYNHQVLIESIDPNDPNFLNNDTNGNLGTIFAGTFNFPATFTLLEPIDNKGGWC